MTDFGEDDGRQGRGTHVQRLATLSGALISLALICGMGYWGYKLLVRDVHGVPVVQAMEGAFRIAPDDPGGTQAPYQGLAVNEIAAGGAAGGPVDLITLAPAPVDLADEDAPRQVLDERRRAAEEAEADAAEADRVAAVGEPGEEIELADGAEEGIEGAAPMNDGSDALETELAELGVPDADRPEANAEEIRIDDRPEGALATDMAVAEALAGLMAEEEGGADTADATSPRPSPRPSALRTAAAAISDDRPVTVSAEMPHPDEIDVAALESGTRLVQLGAFVDADVARREWAHVAEQFGDQFAGKRRVVQEATSGGKTFYRLRAEGFDDLAEARRFCSALLAGKADCIPVALR